MKSLSAFVALLLAAPLWLQAQVPEVDKLLKARNCSEAASVCQLMLDKPESAFKAKLALAEIYLRQDCPEQYSLAKAKPLLLEVQSWWDGLTEKKRQKEINAGFKKARLTKANQGLLKALIAQAPSEPSPLAALTAIQSDCAPLLREQPLNMRKTLEQEILMAQMADIRQSGSLADWAAFAQAHEKPLRQSSALRSRLHELQTAWAIDKDGWEGISKWRDSFPGNPYFTPANFDAFNEVRATSDSTKIGSFIKAQPNNPWKKTATDSLIALRNIDNRIARELATAWRLARRMPPPPADTLAWADAVFAYAWDAGKLKLPTLEDSIARLPYSQLPLTMARVLEAYKTKGLAEDLEAFSIRYPDFHDPAAVEAALLALKGISRRGEVLSPKALTARLRNVSRPETWPSADWQLSALWANMPEEERLKAEAGLASLPPERMPRTLYAIQSQYEAAGKGSAFENQFGAASAKAMYDPKAAARLYEQYGSLLGTIKSALSSQNWATALKEARDEEWADLLTGHRPYAQLLHVLEREEQPREWLPFGGGVLNTREKEFLPVLLDDETAMFFCRAKSGGPFNELETIALAEKGEDGQWKDMGAVDALNGNALNTAPLALTADGRSLMVFQNGKLAHTTRTAQGWEDITLYPNTINTSDWQGISTMSSDGKVIIFEGRLGGIGRDGHIGKTDLYITFLDKKGDWRIPVNLGPIVNTLAEDRSPFLHPDGRTLYFSSEGHGGFGDLDVYKTTRLDDTWLHWSEPVHLGRYANTVGKDWCYKINKAGEFAYFAADPRGNENTDLYMMYLPEDAKPEAIMQVCTRVYQPDGDPYGGNVSVWDAITGELVVVKSTAPGKGKVCFQVLAGYSYTVKVDDGVNLPFEEVFPAVLPEAKLEQQWPDIRLQVMKADSRYTLRRIFFEYNESSLLPESEDPLDEVALQLKARPEWKVKIYGHTDNVGSPASNLRLSKERAEAVRDALIRRGIPAERLETIGRGQSEPTTSNETEAGRQQNRRVEIGFGR